MNTKAMRKQAERDWDDLCCRIEKVVEEMARDILRRHKNLRRFVMAMGSCFFEDKDGNTISTYERSYLKTFDDFLNVWDDRIKITGCPMHFTADGPKITNW